MHRWERLDEVHRAAVESDDLTTTSGDHHLAAVGSTCRATLRAAQAASRRGEGWRQVRKPPMPRGGLLDDLLSARAEPQQEQPERRARLELQEPSV